MSISVLLRWSTQVFFKYQSTMFLLELVRKSVQICFISFIGIIETELQISCFPSNSHKVR